MNLYFEAARCLDKLDAKHGSVNSVLNSFSPADRARGAALLIETLKCDFYLPMSTHNFRLNLFIDKPTLTTIVEKAALLEMERKHLKSKNLALLMVHDLLLARGIQAGDGPLKQAILRHKTRLQSELTRVKIMRGVKSNEELSVRPDDTSSKLHLAVYLAIKHLLPAIIPRYVRVNLCRWTTISAREHFVAKGMSYSPDGIGSATCLFLLDMIDSLLF